MGNIAEELLEIEQEYNKGKQKANISFEVETNAIHSIGDMLEQMAEQLKRLQNYYELKLERKGKNEKRK